MARHVDRYARAAFKRWVKSAHAKKLRRATRIALRQGNDPKPYERKEW